MGLFVATKKIFDKKSDQIIYRGQAHSCWKLEPKLLREEKKFLKTIEGYLNDSGFEILIEKILIDNFINHCDAIALPLPNDSRDFREKISLNNPRAVDHYMKNPGQWPDENIYDIMAIAQHHGLPTRLLDWTRRSYVAAYFAASGALSRRNVDCSRCKTFAVWVINREALNPYQDDLKIIEVPSGYNKNQAAQAGLFTVLKQQASRGSPFEGHVGLDDYLCGKKIHAPIKTITLPKSEAGQVLDLCEKFNITGATLFPSYDGAVKATLDNWCYCG